jgi:hypothetical protein
VFAFFPLRPDTSECCTSDDGDEIPMPGSVPVVPETEVVPAAKPDVLEYKGKAVGAINDRLDFWSDTLFPDAYVRCILSEGYKIPVDWSKIPEEYEEPDNKSAKDKYEFMRSEVDRLVAHWQVVECSHKLRCNNPLTVAVKTWMARLSGGFVWI